MRENRDIVGSRWLVGYKLLFVRCYITYNVVRQILRLKVEIFDSEMFGCTKPFHNDMNSDNRSG